MLVIVHSGQTGVERGAHRGAIAAGLHVTGFMPSDKRDELGPIPNDVAEHLTPCTERGPRQAVYASIALASGVLVVVPQARSASHFTAMAAVLQRIRAARVPFLACDASTNVEDVRLWTRQLPETAGSTRVMVTGPRGTRWPEGEAVARRLVTVISINE